MKHIRMSMDIHKVFGMKGGVGATSYSQNSSLQKRAADKVKHLAVEAMQELLAEKRGSVIKSLGIADLGCSSGPNALSNIKSLLDVNVEAPPHEYRVYLNDLPTNDFNTVFQALPDLYRELNNTCVYIAAYPGSFYGRLFPQDSLHLVYSSNSLHWLSRVPPGIYDEEGSSMNKKSIYISERSPPQVKQAYFKQFQEDMSLFLKSRSAEVVSGGRMVLILLGRSGPQHVDRGNSFFWEILYQSLASLVAEGEVEEDKLESYEVHFYAPSPQELEEQVSKEGSFKLEVVEMFEMDKDSGTYSSYGVAVANTVRSIQESMIAHHFGESILDKLFHLYGRLIDQELSKHDINSITTALILTKL